jgi:hypothetical protein
MLRKFFTEVFNLLAPPKCKIPSTHYQVDPELAEPSQLSSNAMEKWRERNKP